MLRGGLKVSVGKEEGKLMAVLSTSIDCCEDDKGTVNEGEGPISLITPNQVCKDGLLK